MLWWDRKQQVCLFFIILSFILELMHGWFCRNFYQAWYINYHSFIILRLSWLRTFCSEIGGRLHAWCTALPSADVRSEISFCSMFLNITWNLFLVFWPHRLSCLWIIKKLNCMASHSSSQSFWFLKISFSDICNTKRSVGFFFLFFSPELI